MVIGICSSWRLLHITRDGSGILSVAAKGRRDQASCPVCRTLDMAVHSRSDRYRLGLTHMCGTDYALGSRPVAGRTSRRGSMMRRKRGENRVILNSTCIHRADRQAAESTLSTARSRPSL